MRMRAAALLAMALIVAGEARAAVEDAGTTAAGFLIAGTGGAPLGMGGATLGLGGDLCRATWNPGALDGVTMTQLAFSHAGLPDESRQEWLGAGGSFGGGRTHWALQGLFVNHGSFEGRDAFNQPTGSFNATSTALGGSLARTFVPGATAGITARWVSDKLGDVTGSGFTFDTGLLLRRGMFGFGVGAQNLGGEMSYSGARYPFPTNVGAGVSLDHPGGLRLALDMNFPRAYYNDVRAGLEYRWHEMLALRAGYRREVGAEAATEALTGPSFGIGAGARGLWFDYAFLPSTLGVSEHRVGITFVPGKAGLDGGAFGKKDVDSDPTMPALPAAAKKTPSTRPSTTP